MGLMQRLFRKDAPRETKCSRCGVPAPEGSMECTACGWDLREIYHGPTPERAEAAGQSAAADDGR